MGKIDNLNPFLEENIQNKPLILDMLKYEDSIILGDIGKEIFENGTYELFSNLETTYIFHRLTLNYFNFSSKDSDVSNYRKIFSYYYKSPTDYDKEVINSVVYMRENRCIYYTEPKLETNNIIPDIGLYYLDGNTKTALYNEIDKDNKFTIIGAFSNSWPPFLQRKKYLFELAPIMKEKNIGLILVQINEAHSTLWPNGLKDTPLPQKSFEERVDRANKFVNDENCPFKVLIDDWNNSFDNKFRAWPDKYYCVDSELKIVETSSYGDKKDALINKDCLDLIKELLQ